MSMISQEYKKSEGAISFDKYEIEDSDESAGISTSEKGYISQKTAMEINQTKQAGGRIIAVGTTSARLLEAAANNNYCSAFDDETNIFIKPGYRFNLVDGLITNFHLPKSTLIMLVAAFLGVRECKKLYSYAIENKYRFYSYGDSSLLFKKS